MAYKTEYIVPVTGRGVYSGLSSDTKPVGVVAGSEFYETDTEFLFQYSGSHWIQNGSNAATHTRPLHGTGRIVRARTIKTATRDTAEWPAGSSITNLSCYIWPTAAGANHGASLDRTIFGLIAVDAPSDTVAAMWLGGTTNIITSMAESKVADVFLIPVPILQWVEIPLESIMHNGAGGGGRVDVRTNDNTTQLNWLIRGS